ncbi:MAG: hypothetical protein WAW57_07370 [Lutibacter sp.]
MKSFTFVLFITILFSSCGASIDTSQVLINKHPEWPSDKIALILTQKIDIGMSEDMVEAAWGKPNYINKMDGVYTGKVLGWTYYKPFKSAIKTVTFTEGLVSQFSEGSTK